MDRLELRETTPGLRQQTLNPGHIAGSQVGISLHLNLSIRGAQGERRHFRRRAFAEVHLFDTVAEVKLGSPGLDVLQDRTGEPAMGRPLEQIEL